MEFFPLVKYLRPHSRPLIYASPCDLSAPDVDVITPILISLAALAGFVDTGRTRVRVSKEISDVLSEDFIDIKSPRQINFKLT
jgi:hypothetical protein